jgi:hypothetical protein
LKNFRRGQSVIILYCFHGTFGTDMSNTLTVLIRLGGFQIPKSHRRKIAQQAEEDGTGEANKED